MIIKLLMTVQIMAVLAILIVIIIAAAAVVILSKDNLRVRLRTSTRKHNLILCPVSEYGEDSYGQVIVRSINLPRMRLTAIIALASHSQPAHNRLLSCHSILIDSN